MKHKAMLWEAGNEGSIDCALCAHRCRIPDNKFGFCGMRENVGGELYTYAYGEIAAANTDPIEKKPLYHFLPGTRSFSIATIGCNFRCEFCQNWSISQLDVKRTRTVGKVVDPQQIVALAIKNDSASISFTYTEPSIFFEYAYDIAKISKAKGLYNVFVTNGYMTKEAIDLIAPLLDAANVDLKFFNNDTYRKLSAGSLEPVLGSIRYMKEKGIWIEVTTLVIPGINDSEKELKGIAEFIADVDINIPWHISRFHPDYKMDNTESTTIEIFDNAVEIGINAGLKYVYPGNVYPVANTVCPNCALTLIDRSTIFSISGMVNIKGSKCVKCNEHIEGVWGVKS